MKNSKRHLIRHIALTIILVKLIGSTSVYADTNDADWRPDYKSMAQAFYANDYDKAITCAKTTLDKVLVVSNTTEKTIAIDQILRMLRTINTKYEQQQNYTQQESVLRYILKAEQASHNNLSNFQIISTKKSLATCLVLEGKTKEAEDYLAKPVSSMETSTTESGWKKELDLLSDSNGANNRDNTCKYAESVVKEMSFIKNTTERNVAIDQIMQQLQIAEYKYKRAKDFSNEEKILKLMLKVQETKQENDNSKPVQSLATIKKLVTCLVMQGKDNEAARYDAEYKAISENSVTEFQKQLQEQIEKYQRPKPKETI